MEPRNPLQLRPTATSSPPSSYEAKAKGEVQKKGQYLSGGSPLFKWLTTQYLRTNSVAVLLWSDGHSHALGCPFCEEYGEGMLSRLLMRSKEVDNVQPVQQTSDIFLTLPPTLLGQKTVLVFGLRSPSTSTPKMVWCSLRMYHMPGSLVSLFKWTNMWSNGLMKPLPCAFEECCRLLRFQSKILPNTLGIASSDS